MKANVFAGLYSQNCLEIQYPWISRQETTDILTLVSFYGAEKIDGDAFNQFYV